MTDKPPTDDRLGRQLGFLLELDKLKAILRRMRLPGSDRYENSAEHSWHLAMAAVLLAEHANEPVDVAHVVKMVLVHDIVEIDAGDTFCYDTAGYTDKAEREQRAADRIFGLLPDDQRDEMRALWDEFEAVQTPEARFAAALDRLIPVLQNTAYDGVSWREHDIRLDQILTRNSPIAEGALSLWDHIEPLIRAVAKDGWTPTGL